MITTNVTPTGDLVTINASPMLDTLEHPGRSVALVVDRSDLHALRKVLDPTTFYSADEVRTAREQLVRLAHEISTALDHGSVR